jgi:hypothetical protein
MLIPPGIVVALYAHIGSFNRMLGDDYCTTYVAQRLGLLRSMWYWYRSWHGRFSANAADWLLSLAGSEAFPFYTLVFLVFWLAFAVIAVKRALDDRGYKSFPPLAALLLAVFLVFTTLSLTPDLSESLFWWNGVRSYLSPLVFIVLYFAAYSHIVSSSWTMLQNRIWLFFSFGLAFFMGGFSETFTPVLVLLFVVLIGAQWLAPNSSRKATSTLFLSAGFFGAVLSLLVMVLAPGNLIRRAFFPAPPDLFTILRIGVSSYLTFLSGILGSSASLTALLGTALGSIWLGMRATKHSGVAPAQGWRIFAVLAAGLLLAFACFPTAVYATSEPPPERTLIIPAFILVLCVLITGFIFGEWLANRVSPRSFAWTFTSFAVTACSLMIFSAWNGIQRLDAMRVEHISFAQSWDQVDARIKEAKRSGLRQVNIPAMKNWAGLEYPTDNPRYWPNVCYSKYYDINVLSVPLTSE